MYINCSVSFLYKEKAYLKAPFLFIKAFRKKPYFTFLIFECNCKKEAQNNKILESSVIQAIACGINPFSLPFLLYFFFFFLLRLFMLSLPLLCLQSVLNSLLTSLVFSLLYLPIAPQFLSPLHFSTLCPELSSATHQPQS